MQRTKRDSFKYDLRPFFGAELGSSIAPSSLVVHVLTSGGGLNRCSHHLFKAINQWKIENGKWKKNNVMLNLFQHLINLAYFFLTSKILKQVQDDEKHAIACNDRNNLSFSTSHFPFNSKKGGSVPCLA